MVLAHGPTYVFKKTYILKYFLDFGGGGSGGVSGGRRGAVNQPLADDVVV